MQKQDFEFGSRAKWDNLTPRKKNTQLIEIYYNISRILFQTEDDHPAHP